jgi:general stress protein YciG
MARKATAAANTTKKSAKQEDSKLSGRGWHGDPERHAEAGRKGGAKVSQNREHMAEIGRRGGTKVSQNREHMAEIGRRGGSKVSQNRSHMAEIGKKGGESK